MRLTGRVGYGACARATAGRRAARNAAAMRAFIKNLLIVLIYGTTSH
jgi:hypothetical protein